MRDFFADRAQIVSYMLFLLEIYFIERFLENKKIRYIVGIFLISVLIANIHSATWLLMFILVLPFLGEYIFSLYAIDNVTKNRIKRDEKKLEKLKSKNADLEKIKKLEESIKLDKEYVKSYKPKKDGKIIIKKNDNSKFLILVLIVIFIRRIFNSNRKIAFYIFYKSFI